MKTFASIFLLLIFIYSCSPGYYCECETPKTQEIFISYKNSKEEDLLSTIIEGDILIKSKYNSTWVNGLGGVLPRISKPNEINPSYLLDIRSMSDSVLIKLHKDDRQYDTLVFQNEFINYNKKIFAPKTTKTTTFSYRIIEIVK